MTTSVHPLAQLIGSKMKYNSNQLLLIPLVAPFYSDSFGIILCERP